MVKKNNSIRSVNIKKYDFLLIAVDEVDKDNEAEALEMKSLVV